MYKQRIGISIDNDYVIPTSEVVKMLKKIGFDAISPVWEPNADLEAIAKTANEVGLYIQSIHAPMGGAAVLWTESERAQKAKAELFRTIDDCEKYRIPVAVCHAWIGFGYTFDENSLYFGNYDEIVNYASSKGVKIAFENTEGEEYLFALMDHFKDNETVGYCWDSGHEMCYNRSMDLLARLGDRLYMTHINDNLGISNFEGVISWIDDLHLLPYDGIADWDANVERLKKSREPFALNFELNLESKPNRHENDTYRQMSLEHYFTEAYKRAARIAFKYSQNKES